MAENMVRCSGCHEVYDANLGACTKCGLPYKPPVARPEPYQGMYSDRYAAEELPPLDPSLLPTPTPTRDRNSMGLAVGGGIALIACAVVVAILWELGVVGAASATPTPPRIILSITDGPSPTPVLPVSAERAMALLNDQNLSAQITITSHVQVFSGVAGQNPQNSTIKFDGTVSGGNQWGAFTSSGVTQEIRVIDSQIYRRFVPGATWQHLPAMPSYMVVCPMFGLTKDRDLQLVGHDTKGGQTLNHLQTTSLWRPDITRMSMTDLSALVEGPTVEVLDLWTTDDGTPVMATFSGTNNTGDGTKLVDIEVSYTFAKVGVPQTIDVPGPGWSPSPSF
jgi:hypothetical protein